MCVPTSQTRPDASGDLSDDDSNLPSRKYHRSRSAQGEVDSHQQELDPSYVEILNAIRCLLDLEVPQVESLVVPSAFSKKPKQVVRKQNLALPPVQDIKSMWDYRFRKASGTSLKDKSSSESLSLLHNLSPRDSSCQETHNSGIHARKPTTLGYYNRLFLVPKPFKRWRPVIDFSILNSHLHVPTFNMETAESIRKSIQKGE